MKQLFALPNIDSFEVLYTNSTRYFNVTWLTAHNSFASEGEGWIIYKQQSLTLEQMFSYGVRSFMIDVHYKEQTLSLCHGGCNLSWLQKGSPADTFISYLTRVKKLLNDNPNAIITLHLEDNSNNSSDILYEFELSGLKSNLLQYNPNDANITLGFMREKDMRLVVFSDYQKERIKKDFHVKPGIFPTTFYKETIYGSTSFTRCEGRSDDDFRAAYNDSSIKLFVHNHFSTISLGSHTKSNSYQTIANTVNSCIDKGLFPNFLAVDFVEEGNFGGARRIVEDLMYLRMDNNILETNLTIPGQTDKNNDLIISGKTDENNDL